jgi:hypothetical protein
MTEQSTATVSKNESKELTTIKASLELTRDFLCLVELLDTLPNMQRTPYDVTRSLYQAVSKGRDVHRLGRELEGFFGPPKKPAGKPMPVTMRFHPSIKYLHGIREEQALYIRKTKNGFYYGALWPWYKKPGNITVHLGYCGNKMSNKDYENLEKLAKARVLNQKVFNELSATEGGQIHGIGLASFLHMALLEKFTCTLEIRTQGAVGYLFLHDGHLIAAKTGTLKNKAAAYEIISWDSTEIEIRDADPSKKKNEIQQSLMDILTEALRLRKNKAEGSGIQPSAAAKTVQLPVRDRYRALREAQQEPKSRVVPIVGISVLAVLIVAAGYFYGSKYLSVRQAEKEYLGVLAQIEMIEDPADQKILLEYFIDSHQESPLRQEAEEKMQEIENLIVERDYQALIDSVSQLSIDQDYEQKAMALYNEFLDKYPASVRSNEVQVKIAEVPDIVDDYDFEKALAATQLDYGNRIDAYLDYLVKHPFGKHKTQVEAFIADMSEEYYAHLMKAIPRCDKQENWDRCIALSTNFLDYFKNHHRSYEVENLKVVMEDKKDLTILMEKVQRLGNRFEVARQILVDYLEENPETTQAQTIRDKIYKIDRSLRANREWEAAVTFCKNSNNPLIDRINYLNSYIRQNGASPYIGEAKSILAQLQDENHALYQQRIEAERQRQQALLDRERRRIQAEKQNAIAQINQAGSRFSVNGNGTFTDTKSGKVWVLLDSYSMSGECYTYNDAQEFVRTLKTGGYEDWRMPFGSELFELYKTEPFYPGASAPWYWTSEMFNRGHREVALVVTSTRENVFDRVHKDIGECGAVRAVRP